MKTIIMLCIALSAVGYACSSPDECGGQAPPTCPAGQVPNCYYPPPYTVGHWECDPAE